MKSVVVLADIPAATAAIAQPHEWTAVASVSLFPSGMPGRKIVVQR